MALVSFIGDFVVEQSRDHLVTLRPRNPPQLSHHQISMPQCRSGGCILSVGMEAVQKGKTTATADYRHAHCLNFFNSVLRSLDYAVVVHKPRSAAINNLLDRGYQNLRSVCKQPCDSIGDQAAHACLASPWPAAGQQTAPPCFTG